MSRKRGNLLNGGWAAALGMVTAAGTGVAAFAAQHDNPVLAIAGGATAMLAAGTIAVSSVEQAWTPVNKRGRKLFDRLTQYNVTAREAEEIDLGRRVLFARLHLTDYALDLFLIRNPTTPQRVVERIARRVNSHPDWAVGEARFATYLVAHPHVTGELLQDLCQRIVTLAVTDPAFDDPYFATVMLSVAGSRPGAVSAEDHSRLLVHTTTL